MLDKTHPNTIQLKQYIESPNVEYIGIVMTYIEGFSLCSAEFWSQYQKKYPNRKIQRSSEDYIADLQVLEDNMMHDSDVIKFAHKLLDVLAYCRPRLTQYMMIKV